MYVYVNKELELELELEDRCHRRKSLWGLDQVCWFIISDRAVEECTDTSSVSSCRHDIDHIVFNSFYELIFFRQLPWNPSDVSWNTIDDKSTFDYIFARCCHTTSYYLKKIHGVIYEIKSLRTVSFIILDISQFTQHSREKTATCFLTLTYLQWHAGCILNYFTVE